MARDHEDQSPRRQLRDTLYTIRPPAPTAAPIGITVDCSPALGSIDWRSFCHVAYVQRVNSPISVVVPEVSYYFDNGRDGTITIFGGWPATVIHIADR